MAATITTMMDPEGGNEPVFLVTRRELAVLTIAMTMLFGAVLLLVVTSSQLTGALFGAG